MEVFSLACTKLGRRELQTTQNTPFSLVKGFGEQLYVDTGGALSK